MCGAADGTLLPPFIVYKNPNEHAYRQWTENGPKGVPFCSQRCCASGSKYDATKSGWVDARTFSRWFHECVVPHARQLEGRVVILADNLASHFTDEILVDCRAHNISFAYFVPNSTHVSQPLDVAFFRALKEAWRYVLRRFKHEYSRTSGIPKVIFPQLVVQCFEKMNTITVNNKVFHNRIAENLKSGFRACGIVPFNPNAVLQKIPGAITRTEQASALEGELVQFLRNERFKDKALLISRLKKRDIIAGRDVAMQPEEEADVDDPGYPDDAPSTENVLP